jgi:hypothetical protein
MAILRAQVMPLVDCFSIYTHPYTPSFNEALTMIRKDGTEARKQRIQEIIRWVMSKLNQDEEVILSKAISALQFEMGLTGDRIMEYLKIGEDIGRFILDVKNNRIKKTES